MGRFAVRGAVAVASATAFVAWLIWVVAAPESQDNSFHANGHRLVVVALVSCLGLVGMVSAGVTSFFQRDRRRLLVSLLLANIAMVSFCLWHVSIPNASTLIRAVRDGDQRRVRRILNRGVDVNGLGRWGWSDSAGGTAFLTAIEQGDLEMVELLLDAGADPGRGSRGDSGWTPLQAAACHNRHEIAKLLLDAGADANREEPLVGALQVGNLCTAELLVQRGADVRVSETLLRYRAERTTSTIAALEFLIAHGWDVNEPIVSRRRAQTTTPLLVAVEEDYTDVVELLLANGADANFRPLTGRPKFDFTPYPLCAAAERGNLDIAVLLLEAGAEVNLADGNSVLLEPLYLALWASHYEMAELLIDHGARPTLSIYSSLLLHRQHQRSFEELKPKIEFLLDHGLDTASTTDDGRSQLRAVTEDLSVAGEVLEYLDQRGIK